MNEQIVVKRNRIVHVEVPVQSTPPYHALRVCGTESVERCQSDKKQTVLTQEVA